MKILIVGAGPAGLAAANFLQTQSHDITVIEKEQESTTMGFGIYLFNQGKSLLRKATHATGMQAFLRQIGYKKYIDEQGKDLGDIHYNQLFHIHSYDASISIKREDLHALLRKHVSKNVEMKMGTTIASIVNTPDYADVRLSDGMQSRYDLVISAEGTNSQLRNLFFSYTVQTLPWIARYFWIDVPMKRFAVEWSRDATVMFMPHKDRTTALSIESPDVFAYADEHGVPPPALLAFYASMGLSKADIERCYAESHISSMRYVMTKEWVKHRVVLIGDAQHAMTPTLGFGTSLALDDAYHLAEAIKSVSNGISVEKALQAFSRERTRKICILRLINKYADLLSYRRSKLYYDFWYRFRSVAVKIAHINDRITRWGWKYA